MDVKPLRDLVLVKRGVVEDTTSGGIFLPEGARERSREGVVIAVGEGRVLDNGTLLRSEVRVGDVVLYSQFGGTDIKVDGEDCLILDDNGILAVKEEEGEIKKAKNAK